MKIGIIPDLHGSPLWKDIINNSPEVEKWIFVGDYVDSFVYDKYSILENLKNIIEHKKLNNDTTVLLLGNHDIQYLYNDPWYRCSGYTEETAFELGRLFNENVKLFDLAYKHQDYLITHAGITESWLKKIKIILKTEYKLILDEIKLHEVLNDILHYGPKAVFDIVAQIGKKRGGWETSGGPLWCDEYELRREYAYNFNQIVGHTPQKTGEPKKMIMPTGEVLIFVDLGEANKLRPLIIE